MGKKGKRTARLNEGKKKEDARSAVIAKFERLALTFKNDKICDTDLFAPPSPRPECPICMLTMPLRAAECVVMSCCGNLICYACREEQLQVCKETNEKNVTRRRPLMKVTCAFCREPAPSNETEVILRLRKGADNNDPRALHQMAILHGDGTCGFQKDELKALEFTHRAAELGSTEACIDIAIRYGDVAKDEWKKRIFLQVAAINGHAYARQSLGVLEYRSNQRESSMRHFRISAAVGCEISLNILKGEYAAGRLSKDELASVLRAFQTSQDEMKSEARDWWAAAKEN
mmetsp:Transcript_4586/g.8933  ORF Transcript_4586/g.8933 Transcript_4586/m.8933 type:complete len:288 (-) Transcript_4586:74-937(-)